jgi:hypothetical protein
MQVPGRYDLAFHTSSVGKHSPHVAFDLRGSFLEQTGVAADECSGETGALPEVVMRGLGYGGAEAALELRLEGRQLLTLALEAGVRGEVELDLEDRYERH